MRDSTMLGIGFFVLTFFSAILLKVILPDNLHDLMLFDMLRIAGFLGRVTTIFFIAMMFCFGYAIYENIMEKNVNITHVGNNYATGKAKQKVNYGSFVVTNGGFLSDIGDPVDLIAELSVLRQHLLTNGSREDVISAGELAKAEASLEKADIDSAFSALAAGGKYALDAAMKIGTPVATAALKKAIGL